MKAKYIQIQLHNESELDEKKKEFYTTIFAHDTPWACDIFFPTFKYIDKISAWVEVDEAIENWEIMFLDFSLYDK